MTMIHASGGDRAEYFVEPSRLELQLLQLQALARGEFRDRRQDCCPAARQCREARLALADLDTGNGRQGGEGAAEGGELLRFLQLQGYGVVVTRTVGESYGRVVGDDATA